MGQSFFCLKDFLPETRDRFFMNRNSICESLVTPGRNFIEQAYFINSDKSIKSFSELSVELDSEEKINV